MGGSEIVFDHNCLILATDHEIRLVRTSKTTVLKGRNLGLLHRRLAPFISGRYSEDMILAAVPGRQRPSVERYLAAMRTAGSIRISGRAVPSRKTGGGLALATKEQIQRRLLHPSVGDSRGAFVFLENSTASSADWVLKTGALVMEPGTVAVYRVTEDPFTITREFVIRRKDPVSAIPGILGLVQPVEVSQLPLAILQASHWLYPDRVTRCGVSRIEVETQLVREFAARALIREKALVEQPQRQLLVAGSKPCLKAAILDHMASRLPVDRAIEIDLLTEPSDHPEIRFLCGVLKTRLKRLPGLIECVGKFRAYRCGRFRACSLIQAKALRDVLVDVAGSNFYESAWIPGSVPRLPDYENFASASTLPRLIFGSGLAADSVEQRARVWDTEVRWGYAP